MQFIPLVIQQTVTNCGHLKGMFLLQRYTIITIKYTKLIVTYNIKDANINTCEFIYIRCLFTQNSTVFNT